MVSSNLAIVFANNNERTLLIDADLHKPSQQKAFTASEGPGLSMFLADSAEAASVIRKTGIPNLDFVSAGRVPLNAPELLGSTRMRELIEEARQNYDRIIIDTPPVSAVSDPLILLPHTDGVVFVIRFNMVRREIALRSIRRLQECEAPLMGAVINNIDLEGYGFYYHPYQYLYYYRKTEKVRVDK